MTHSQRLGLALAVSVLLHGALLWAVRIHPGSSGNIQQVLSLELEAVPGRTASGPLSGMAASPQDLRLPSSEAKRVSPTSPKALNNTQDSSGDMATAAPAIRAPESPASTTDLRLRSLQMARQEADIPFAGQRVRAISPQTRDSVFGPYEEAYRLKVEQVGTVNYPAPVNGRMLYGSVRLTATIRADGSLALLEVRRSSGNADLDRAAQQIVRMAAPFQPFSETMLREADLVSITRTFNFTHAGEAISSQQ